MFSMAPLIINPLTWTQRVERKQLEEWIISFFHILGYFPTGIKEQHLNWIWDKISERGLL